MKVNLKKFKEQRASEDKLISLVTNYINNARLIGMAVSAKAISQIIYDIAHDAKLTEAQRLDKISRFCETGINNDDKQKEILSENVGIGKSIALELVNDETIKTKKPSAVQRLAKLFSVTVDEEEDNTKDREENKKKGKK